MIQQCAIIIAYWRCVIIINNTRKELYFDRLHGGKLDRTKITWRVLGSYEDELRKDVAEMSLVEIQQFFSKMSFLRYARLRDYKYEIISYCNWCTDRCINVNFDPKNINAKDNTNVDTVWFASPEHLRKCLYDMTIAWAPERFAFVYRTFIWMIYIGIPKNSVNKVRVENVSADYSSVWYERKYFEIPESAKKDFKMCVECQSVQMNSGRTIQRKQNDYLLRTEISASLSLYSVRKIAEIAEAERRHSLAFDNVRLSGLFYRMLMTEWSGYGNDLVAIADEEARIFGKQFEDDAAHMRYVNWFKEQIPVDYKRWKNAFGYDV